MTEKEDTTPPAETGEISELPSDNSDDVKPPIPPNTEKHIPNTILVRNEDLAGNQINRKKEN